MHTAHHSSELIVQESTELEIWTDALEGGIGDKTDRKRDESIDKVSRIELYNARVEKTDMPMKGHLTGEEVMLIIAKKS